MENTGKKCKRNPKSLFYGRGQEGGLHEKKLYISVARGEQQEKQKHKLKTKDPQEGGKRNPWKSRTGEEAISKK